LPPGSFGKTQTAFETLVHPDDRVEVRTLVERALETGQPMEGEWRVVWPDGSIHWIAGRWQALRDHSGKPVRMTGVNIDTTERKMAQDALANFSRRLLEAQEEERKRIARELHDDINQRIAALTIELAKLDQHLPDSAMDVHDYIRQVGERLSEVASDIQALSHRLHSSKLEYLGIAAAAASFCREFSKQQQVEIDFSHAGIPRNLPKQISLCLFRVLQEALQNAVKYSGVRRFTVDLRGTSGEIQLSVRDQGVGFNTEKAKVHSGLGLISMRERLQLVGGEFSINSEPGRGTTVNARVPLRTERTEPLAANRSAVGY
jgi:signal transduction histidine kinase